MAAAGKAMSRESLRGVYLIRRLREPEEIRPLLQPVRLYAAYGLAQLEPEQFGKSEWWLADGDGEKSLVMHSRGGLGRAMLTLGDEIGLDALLKLHPGPVYAFATFPPEHQPVIRRFYTLAQSRTLLRMVVDRESFAKAPPLSEESSDHAYRQAGAELRPLSGRDVGEVNRLNSAEMGNIRYRASQLEEGTYFGVYIEGKLVSIAGTHGVATSEGIAVVGNVFTHPQHRNHHFALQATSVVTSALLDTCREVVLTVDPQNEPAVKAYRRLGYRDALSLIESGVTRREPFAIASMLRRFMARRRGRAYGGEIVDAAAMRWDIGD